MKVALVAGLPGQTKVQIPEVPESAVKKLGTMATRARSKIVGFYKGNAHPAKSGITED